MYRDHLGRFAVKPTTPTPLPYHNVRDEKGRFASKVTPPILGQQRDARGRFLPKPKFPKPTNLNKVTVQDVVNAIRANGVRQARNEYVRYDKSGNVVSACAIGQAAINLGVDYASLYRALNHDDDGKPMGLGSKIISLNDTRRKSLQEIADTIEALYPSLLKKRLGESLTPHTYSTRPK